MMASFLVISSTVIENIMRGCREDPRYSACAYFFFDGRSAQSDLSSHDGMIRSLIRQLVRRFKNQRDDARLLANMFHFDQHLQPSTVSLQVALQDIIQMFDCTYIIIDALDECTDKTKFLVWIGELLKWGDPGLRVFLSSRLEHEIEEHLKRIPDLIRVPLAGPPVDTDIERYIDAMLQSNMSKWDAPLRAMVKEMLLDGADGMCVTNLKICVKSEY